MGISEADIKAIKAFLVKQQITKAGAIKYLGRLSSSISVLLGSDFHNGSIYSLCSPHPTREDGLEIKPTSQQKALWDIFERIPERISNCCSAKIIETDVCSKCNEHCKIIEL